jgi:lipopolysaccharide biosynthesis glycosyltransferase
MSKNAIVVTNINFDNIFKYTHPFFEKYSKKTGADLIIIDKKTINVTNNNGLRDIDSTYEAGRLGMIRGTVNYYVELGRYQDGYPNNRFENLQVAKYFDTYDRIFLLDCDVIIKPNCPNYFNTNPNGLYISRVDLHDNYRLQKSIERVKLVQNQLGKIEGWEESYFNSGVMMLSKQHAKLFDYNFDDINTLYGKTQISNFYNWNARKLKYNIVDLGPKFNYFGSYKFLAGIKKEEANILHYPGSKGENSENLNSIIEDSNHYLGINGSII